MRLRGVLGLRVVTTLGVRSVAVIDLCVTLLSATSAQIARQRRKSLSHEQCEYTQHGEDSSDDGAAEHRD